VLTSWLIVENVESHSFDPKLFLLFTFHSSLLHCEQSVNPQRAVDQRSATGSIVTRAGPAIQIAIRFTSTLSTFSLCDAAARGSAELPDCAHR
jgi:hypothetical protein